jgi:23S rRNA (uracil1939-C5)-methyltransferase
VLEVTVGELAHGGAAVTRVEGRVVFVEGALPGETVRAEVVHRRKDFWRAEVRAVLDPSPLRVEPPCPFYTQGCGGCQLQHLAYFEQLEQKRLVLTQQLRRAQLAWPGERVEVLAMDEPWRYRIRGEFHVLHRGETTRLGFYRKRTYQTLPIDDCLIHAEPISRALPAFEAAAADPKAARVQALQFTWAPGSNDLLWSPYPPGSADPGFAARAAPLIADLNLNDDSIGMEDDGRQFRVRPEVFVQVNARQRVILYQQALDLLQLEGAERVVDAYAGIGMLSARLAARSHDVICLEESPYAVRLGELNMRLNECGNVLYQRGAVEETLPRLAQPIDALVADPPRAGCADTAVRAIRESGAKRIVYISCEPSTLARDLARLCDGGRYTLRAVALVDMFPQTYHIEAVVGLSLSA